MPKYVVPITREVLMEERALVIVEAESSSLAMQKVADNGKSYERLADDLESWGGMIISADNDCDEGVFVGEGYEYTLGEES